ncbi:hypothetical protein [Candidatus Tokpelaia sp.]|nr:hypothetical protein [Candidatus Tokpelaia sp.]
MVDTIYSVTHHQPFFSSCWVMVMEVARMPAVSIAMGQPDMDTTHL